MQHRIKEFITFSSAASQAVPEDRAEQTISKLSVNYYSALKSNGLSLANFLMSDS